MFSTFPMLWAQRLWYSENVWQFREQSHWSRYHRPRGSGVLDLALWASHGECSHYSPGSGARSGAACPLKWGGNVTWMIESCCTLVTQSLKDSIWWCSLVEEELENMHFLFVWNDYENMKKFCIVQSFYKKRSTGKAFMSHKVLSMSSLICTDMFAQILALQINQAWLHKTFSNYPYNPQLRNMDLPSVLHCEKWNLYVLLDLNAFITKHFHRNLSTNTLSTG